MASRPRAPPPQRGVAAPWSRRLAFGIWTAAFYSGFRKLPPLFNSRRFSHSLVSERILEPTGNRTGRRLQPPSQASVCAVTNDAHDGPTPTPLPGTAAPRQEPVQFGAALGEQGPRVRPFHLKMHTRSCHEAIYAPSEGARLPPRGFGVPGGAPRVGLRSSQHSEPAGCCVPLSAPQVPGTGTPRV